MLCEEYLCRIKNGHSAKNLNIRNERSKKQFISINLSLLGNFPDPLGPWRITWKYRQTCKELPLFLKSNDLIFILIFFSLCILLLSYPSIFFAVTCYCVALFRNTTVLVIGASLNNLIRWACSLLIASFCRFLFSRHQWWLARKISHWLSFIAAAGEPATFHDICILVIVENLKIQMKLFVNQCEGWIIYLIDNIKEKFYTI